MRFDERFLDELRARTPLAALIGRRVKLIRSGRQWKGCCPFHGEKTPSFNVYDDHFHCYGCGAHGDAISFVMQSQGASFPEAVAALAAEAGLELPAPGAEESEKTRERNGIVEALAAAETWFRARLGADEGRPALDYCRRRGLTDATIGRFGLGWSGGGRGTLRAALGRDGFSPETLLAAGLLRPEEDGSPGLELFFDRLMFPIRDRNGRVIAFGGRTLGDRGPKYVNGPETAVFAKRRALYGIDAAREAARAGKPVLAVEGYLDVISLYQAGFEGAVAPLGTALTAEQLELLWRLSPRPILCFDGDAAGARAAARAAELALPLLTAERSLAIASLPAGEDPDSLLRKRGAAAMREAISGARPLVDALYDLRREADAPRTPEARAAFRQRLTELARTIPDRALASEYRAAWLDRFFAARRAPAPRPQLTRPALTAEHARTKRLHTLLRAALADPSIFLECEEEWVALEAPADLARFFAAAAETIEFSGPVDTASLKSHLAQSGFERHLEALDVDEVSDGLGSRTNPKASWRHHLRLLKGEMINAEREALIPAMIEPTMIEQSDTSFEGRNESGEKVSPLQQKLQHILEERQASVALDEA